MPYKAPIRDLNFAAVHLADFKAVTALSEHQDFSEDLLTAILEEAGKIGEEVLAPINHSGDKQGVKLKDGKVITADGWKQAYNTFIEGGWNGLPFDPDRGGQGLPWLAASAVQEIWHASNMAFSLCTLLTQAAIEALELHGTRDQKDTYLDNLISGVWAGTMNLTEPQAGTDLAAVKTMATPRDDHYLLKGQKIYITYGDHDLTENIIHLVLARTPDAPPGIKGISLFIVPKFLPDDEGNWTRRNDIETVSLESKLGIHASPTAVLAYGSGKYGDMGGAKGYLVGELHQGMVYMFTMMNIARHAVGLEGNGVSERAYQHAVAYANDRVQGSAIEDPKGGNVTIINHPDVRRMLMVQKCRIEALRSAGLVLGASFDLSIKHEDEETRRRSQAMVDILTPIIKSHMTDLGVEHVSLALQVHGGMGFIEETGAAQFYRDQRITPIYEGTNGIQALDLVGRKLMRDGGETAQIVIEQIREDMDRVDQDALADMKAQVENGLQTLSDTIDDILAMAKQDVRQPASICDPYLKLWGTVVGGWQMARAAGAAMALDDGTDPFYANKLETAKFYFAWEMPRVAYNRSVITQSAQPLADMKPDIFETMQ